MLETNINTVNISIKHVCLLHLIKTLSFIVNCQDDYRTWSSEIKSSTTFGNRTTRAARHAMNESASAVSMVRNASVM